VATVSSKPFNSLHQQGLQELYCSDQANVRDTQRYDNAQLSIHKTLFWGIKQSSTVRVIAFGA
jgi:hypothetical protein